jgi:type II secretory pathway pseudopilin PulG
MVKESREAAAARDTEESRKYNRCMNLAGQGKRALRRADGYAMAALLVGLSVMSVLMSMALPVWSHFAKREKEEELIWRGKQYARAVGLFQRKYANTFPPTLDVLVEQKFLRKKYKDPITNDDFQLIPAGSGSPTPGMVDGSGARFFGAPAGASSGRGGTTPPTTASTQPGQPGGGVTAAIAGGGNVNLGIAGVVSKSKDASIKIYNGRQKYNEWAFVYLQTAQRVGVPGQPGAPAGAGFPGMPSQPMPGRGSTFTPFGAGTPGLPGSQGLPPGGRGFQVPPPDGSRPPVPFGQPQGQPFGQPMPPPRPPGI